MEKSLKVKQVELTKIRPYEKNPRRNDNAVDAVANSIREFGFKVPIVIDKDNTIVTGHTRYKAAKRLGIATVPVIVADDLTPEQVKAFRLADNKVSELAGWDYDLLKGEMGEIKIDMLDFGFPEFLFDSSEEPVDEGREPIHGNVNVPSQPISRESLPRELQDAELEPTPIEKIEGDGKTLMERVIIVYPKEREGEIAKMLGLEKIEKVVYSIDDFNVR